MAGSPLPGNSSGNDGLAVFSGLFAFGTISVMVLLTLIWSVAFLPIIGGRYAVEQRFGAMFEFSEIFAEVGRAGVGALLVLLLTVIIASFVGNLEFRRLSDRRCLHELLRERRRYGARRRTGLPPCARTRARYGIEPIAGVLVRRTWKRDAMDLGRAFSYVFEDAEWVKKILIKAA
ncbi:MAG: DUF4013 domain-containing protein [Thermomicrobiales bacterium]